MHQVITQYLIRYSAVAVALLLFAPSSQAFFCFNFGFNSGTGARDGYRSLPPIMARPAAPHPSVFLYPVYSPVYPPASGYYHPLPLTIAPGRR